MQNNFSLRMKRLLVLPLMLFLMALSTISQGQTVTSDLPDYAPGSTATITGAGFTAGEDILIHVDHFFDFYGHEDESYTIVAADNLDGSFVFYYEVGLDEAYDEFVLTASQASGKEASTYFTDGLINTNLELVASSTSFAPGTSVTLTATLTYKIDSKTYAPLVGKAVHFSVFGSEVGAGTTNSSGVATYTINVTPSPIPTVTTAYSGTNGFRVDFNDDATYAKSFDNVNFEVVIACTPPAAPTSGGDQNVCAESSIQTLTATATAPISASVVWYDADGNVVLSPTWNQIGTKTYYAESQNTPTCVSVVRTPVTLTINATPDVPTAENYDMPYDGASHAVSATVTGENVVVDWYADETGGIALGSAPARTNAGITTAWAEARNTVTGCKSANRTQVTVAIRKVQLTVTADNKSKYCGQDNPSLTVTISGFVNNETLETSGVTGSASVTTIADVNSTAGTFTITASLENLASENYSFSFVNGTLTVYSFTVEVTITANPVEMGKPTDICVNVSATSGNQDFTGIAVNYTLDDGNSTTTDVTVTGFTSQGGTFCTTKYIAIAEVYSITATAGCATSLPAYLAVYDPNGGFVTGGGWITSPVVSTLPYMNVGGKANFGFVSKYKKGSNVPEGNTQFQFQAGNLNFSSSSYTAGTLVVAGSQAIYKGVGTINGAGSYGFMVSAVDGQLSGGGGNDKFRIKIWDKASGATVYDNNENAADNATATTVLGGGSIVIHSAESKTKLAQITPEAQASTFAPTLKLFPNPFTERLNIEFSYQTDTKAKLEIFSVTGAKIETLYDGPVSGGQLYNFEYLPRLTGSQMVFYHLTLDGKTQVGKILFNERR